MRYRVKAIGSDARVVDTELDAPSEGEARALAIARGLVVLSLTRAGRVGGGRARFPLLLFNQELLALLRAGIPLAEAVAALSEKETRAPVRSVLSDIVAALREGQPLSRALERAPQAFPDLYVAMIRAAERTSDLERALERYVAYQQQVDTLRGKLVSAAIYPALLVGVGGLVVMFLLGYVVPRFSHIYEDVGNDLPWLSQVLLDWGRLVEAHALDRQLQAGAQRRRQQTRHHAQRRHRRNATRKQHAQRTVKARELEGAQALADAGRAPGLAAHRRPHRLAARGQHQHCNHGQQHAAHRHRVRLDQPPPVEQHL